MPSYFEMAVIAFVTLGIVWTVFRGGQANPEGTGKLGEKLTKLEAQVTTLGRDVREVKSKVTAVDMKVVDIERESITAADIAALKELIEAKHEARGQVMVTIQTDINIIKEHLMKKGLGG